jgi:hypothetical protein
MAWWQYLLAGFAVYFAIASVAYTEFLVRECKTDEANGGHG